jgi:hypothetical protein
MDSEVGPVFYLDHRGTAEASGMRLTSWFHPVQRERLDGENVHCEGILQWAMPCVMRLCG